MRAIKRLAFIYFIPLEEDVSGGKWEGTGVDCSHGFEQRKIYNFLFLLYYFVSFLSEAKYRQWINWQSFNCAVSIAVALMDNTYLRQKEIYFKYIYYKEQERTEK